MSRNFLPRGPSDTPSLKDDSLGLNSYVINKRIFNPRSTRPNDKPKQPQPMLIREALETNVIPISNTHDPTTESQNPTPADNVRAEYLRKLNKGASNKSYGLVNGKVVNVPTMSQREALRKQKLTQMMGPYGPNLSGSNTF